MPAFNLVEKPWIPVRWEEPKHENRPLVSLSEAFRYGEEIADLDCAPHERIAVMRLLVCIAQAAIGAPEREFEWPEFGEGIEESVENYLKTSAILPAFELFGEGGRFLQTTVENKESIVPASKLDPRLATGNNPTLLDHAASADVLRVFREETLALALLTFQNFYPLYGAGYRGKGPCVDGNMLHSILVGKNLLETILANCLDGSTIETHFPAGMGIPVWEHPIPIPDTVTGTYLGRLVPVHRSVWLADDQTGFYLKKDGMQYSNLFREPSGTLVVDGGERKVLGARLGRGIWRDLHVVTVRKSAETPVNSPLVIQSHGDQIYEGKLDLWTGAMITDFKAKVHDTVESTFSVPQNLFTEEGRRTHQAGAEFAEIHFRKNLFAAIKNCFGELKHDAAPIHEAERHYWHIVDQNHGILLDIVRGLPESRRGQAVFGTREASDEWTRLIRSAARRAYDVVCPSRTPRQLEAYTKGLGYLYRYVKLPRPPAKKAVSSV